jgi:hypothetical protein
MAGGRATAKTQVAVCFFSSEESPAFFSRTNNNRKK